MKTMGQGDKETISIDDPRHPLQMDLEAAKMAVRKWRNFEDAAVSDERKASAAATRAFHEGRVEGFKRRIQAAREGVANACLCPACKRRTLDAPVVCRICRYRVRRTRPEVMQDDAAVLLVAMQTLPQVGRPLKASSQATEDAELFRKACQTARVRQFQCCGPRAVELLLLLRKEPMPLAERRGSNRKSDCRNCMGVVIMHKLAVYDMDRQCYHLTARGEGWLAELEGRGLLPQSTTEVVS